MYSRLSEGGQNQTVVLVAREIAVEIIGRVGVRTCGRGLLSVGVTDCRGLIRRLQRIYGRLYGVNLQIQSTIESRHTSEPEQVQSTLERGIPGSVSSSTPLSKTDPLISNDWRNERELLALRHFNIGPPENRREPLFVHFLDFSRHSPYSPSPLTGLALCFWGPPFYYGVHTLQLRVYGGEGVPPYERSHEMGANTDCEDAENGPSKARPSWAE